MKRERVNSIWTVIMALGAMFILLSMAVYPLQSVSAQMDNDRKDEVEIEDIPEERDRGLSFLSDDDYAEIESVYEGDDMENALHIRLESGSNPRFELDYASEKEMKDDSAEHELQMSLVFEEIIEYVDEDGNGMWSSGEEVVQTINLDDYSFSAPSVTQLMSEVKGYRLETMTMGNFVFKLVAYSYEEKMTHEGLDLLPTDMKFDIIIQNFPYVEEDTKIALKIDIETEIEIEDHYTSSSEKRIEIESTEAAAFFSWSAKCEVDGASGEVLSSSIATDEDGQSYVYLFYPRADNIIHDPILGVNTNLAVSSDVDTVVPSPILFLMGILGALAIVIGSVYWRRKKNGMHR